MASPDIDSEREQRRDETRDPTAIERDRGILQRWRERTAQRRLARLLRPGRRRVLAQSLRGAARDAAERDSCLHSTVLLQERAAAVRRDLLEIAALLEQARDPSPEPVKEIHKLLTEANSPLYDRGAHVSELHATLYYIRAELQHASSPPQA